MNKVCTKCNVEKNEEQFLLNKTNGYRDSKCNPCRIEYLCQYRKDNRERLIAFDRARHAANPEAKRDMAKRWAKEHREQHNKNTKRWADNNRDKMRSMISEWGKNNRDKCRVLWQKRRARVLGNGGTFTAEQWDSLKDICGRKCLCCGRPESDRPLASDHVVPLSCGGLNEIQNIQPLCMVCNSSKGTRNTDYRNAQETAASKQLQSVADSSDQGCSNGSDSKVTSCAPSSV